MKNHSSFSLPLRSALVVGQGLFVLATALLWLYLSLWHYEAPGGIWLSSTLFTLHFLWALWSWYKYNHHWFDCYVLFFISLCCFNGGLFFLETCGACPQGILELPYSESLLNQAALVVLGSIILFHSAALYCCLTSRDNSHHLHSSWKDVYSRRYNLQNLRTLGLLFLVISMPFIIIRTIGSLNMVIQSGYMVLYLQESKVGIENWQNVLCGFFVPGILFLLASSPKHLPTVITTGLMIVFYNGSNLFVGLRGAASTSIVAFLMLYHTCVSRIRPALIGLLCVGAIIIFPSIQAARLKERAGGLLSYLKQLSKHETHWYDTIAEMGTSFGTVVGTMNLVPEMVPFDYGLGYQRAAMTVFPNISGIERPKAYSYWYIESTDPLYYAKGGSMGYSVIAEAYINFSWYGPPIVLGLMGFFLAKFVCWTRKNSHPFELALEAVLLTSILILPRAETAVCLRPIVWFCLIPYLIVRCTSGFEPAILGAATRPIAPLGTPGKTPPERVKLMRDL